MSANIWDRLPEVVLIKYIQSRQIQHGCQMEKDDDRVFVQTYLCLAMRCVSECFDENYLIH